MVSVAIVTMRIVQQTSSKMSLCSITPCRILASVIQDMISLRYHQVSLVIFYRKCVVPAGKK